jgi:hypothetical protein
MQNLLYIFCFLIPVFGFSQVEPKLDSLNQQSAEQLSSLSAIISDSLQIRQELDSLQQLQSSLDTLQLKQTLDSLQRLEMPVGELQTKADSVQGLLDVSAKANRQIEELNRKLNDPIHTGRQGVQAKIDKVTTIEDMDPEGLAELKKHSGIDVNTNLPQVEGIKLDGIEGMDLPEVKFSGEGASLPGLSQLDLPGIPKPELPGIESLEGIQQDISKLGDVADQAGTYTEDMAKLGEGKLNELENVDQLAEERFRQSEAGKAFQQQAGLSESGLGEARQLTGRDYMKENAKEKVYAAATDHFAGQQEKLKAAKAELSKYKGRFEKVESMKDMPKGFFRLNPLKDKPWQERIVIGSLWQFGKQEQYLIDFGPTLAWRFNDKLSAGGGFQYRLSISTDHKPWINSSDRVLGYFVFADFKFKKGFFARLTYEDLQTNIPRFNASHQVERIEQSWVKGFSAGIGKSYTFYKELKGYSLLQYNILHRYAETPYTQPIQAKIGFFINGKQLRKKKR